MILFPATRLKTKSSWKCTQLCCDRRQGNCGRHSAFAQLPFSHLALGLCTSSISRSCDLHRTPHTLSHPTEDWYDFSLVESSWGSPGYALGRCKLPSGPWRDLSARSPDDEDWVPHPFSWSKDFATTTWPPCGMEDVGRLGTAYQSCTSHLRNSTAWGWPGNHRSRNTNQTALWSPCLIQVFLCHLWKYCPSYCWALAEYVFQLLEWEWISPWIVDVLLHSTLSFIT